LSLISVRNIMLMVVYLWPLTPNRGHYAIYQWGEQISRKDIIISVATALPSNRVERSVHSRKDSNFLGG